MPLVRASFVPVQQCVSDRPVWDNETLHCRPTRWPTRFLPKCCDNAFLRSAPISYGTLIKLCVFCDLRAHYKNDSTTVLNYQNTTSRVLYPPLCSYITRRRGWDWYIGRVIERVQTLRNYERSGYTIGRK